MITIADSYKKYISTLYQSLEKIDKTELETFIGLIVNAIKENKNIFIIGNGGSASTSQHWSNDLSKGLYHKAKIKAKALSLTDNFSWISAIANDVHFHHIFSDQVKTFGVKGDLLISISASGNSENILTAIKVAKEMEITTVSLIGFDGGKAMANSDYSVYIPSEKGQYGIVEDIHLILNHFICEYLSTSINLL